MYDSFQFKKCMRMDQYILKGKIVYKLMNTITMEALSYNK